MDHTATWNKKNELLLSQNNIPPSPLYILKERIAVLKSIIKSEISYVNSNRFHVQMLINEKVVTLTGMYDTGNHLYEPIQHLPVCIVAADALNGILSDDEWQNRLRMIPYQSIGVPYGMMRGFIADALHIYLKKEILVIEHPAIAVANHSIKAPYSIIMHPDLFIYMHHVY